MRKLKVGAVIGESFKIWRGSLGDLLKNNWLLIITAIVVFGGFGYLLDAHTGAPNMLGSFAIQMLFHLFSLMIFGYVLRYVVNGEKQSIGLGGLYFNMPLLRMIAAGLLIAIVVFAVMMVFGLIIVFASGGQMGSMMMHGGVSAALMGGGILLVFPIMLYLVARLMVLLPFCFLNNQINLSKPFAMTKGNVMRIWAAMFLSGFVVLSMSLVVGLIGWGVLAVVPMLEADNLLLAPVGGVLFTLIWCFSLVVHAVIYKHLSSDLKELVE